VEEKGREIGGGADLDPVVGLGDRTAGGTEGGGKGGVSGGEE